MPGSVRPRGESGMSESMNKDKMRDVLEAIPENARTMLRDIANDNLAPMFAAGGVCPISR